MVYRLNSLRHDTVISCNYKDSDIRNIGAPCTHRCECLMSRGIKEGYLLSVILYLISTDMLCDTACLSFGNVSVSYPVKDRGLTVVNVTHNNNDRASLNELILGVSLVLDKSFLDSNVNFLLNLCAELLSHECRSIEVYDLINRCHNSETHKFLDDLCSCYLQPACKLGNHDLIGDHYFKLLLSCSFKL